jgi:hypothetical protein
LFDLETLHRLLGKWIEALAALVQMKEDFLAHDGRPKSGEVTGYSRYRLVVLLECKEFADLVRGRVAWPSAAIFAATLFCAYGKGRCILGYENTRHTIRASSSATVILFASKRPKGSLPSKADDEVTQRPRQ